MRICETLGEDSCGDLQDFGMRTLHGDLQGFARLWKRICEDSWGFMRICKTLGEDLWGFARICKTLGEDLWGFARIHEDL